MKYHSFAVVMLLQSASLVSAVHQLRSSKIEKSLDKNIEDFEAQLKTNKHHKHHHVSSLAQQDDDEAPDVAAAEEQASDAIAPKTTTTVAQAEATEENKAEKTDSYPAPDDKDIAKLKSLYDFSRRPQTDNWKDKEHHEYNPWNDPTDYHGYNMRDAKTQMMDVKVISNSRISNNKSGRHCLPFDFFTIQYKGFLQEAGDMVKVLDSRKVNSGRPITFQQGNFHVVKCWDLAGILLHAGEKIRISCPAYLSNGGAESYSHFGSKKIPANSPITYELEILECQPRFEDLIAVGKKWFIRKTAGNVVGSAMENFDGDNTHQKDGTMKRQGGGDYDDVEFKVKQQTTDANKKIAIVKDTVAKQKDEAVALEKTLKKDQDDMKRHWADGRWTYYNMKNATEAEKYRYVSQQTERMIKSEDKVVIANKNIQKSNKQIKKITERTKKAVKAVMSSTDPIIEQKAVKTAAKANKKAEDELKKHSQNHDSQRQERADKIAKVSSKRGALLPQQSCFNLITMTNSGSLLALTQNKEDKYAPKTTGVFDITVRPLWRTWNAQKWSYNADTKSFTSYNYKPNAAITEGKNGNLFLYNNLKLKIQQFELDKIHGFLRNYFTNKVASVGKEISKRTWAGDITGKILPDVVGQHWKALPCDATPMALGRSRAQSTETFDSSIAFDDLDSEEAINQWIENDNIRQDEENKQHTKDARVQDDQQTAPDSSAEGQSVSQSVDQEVQSENQEIPDGSQNQNSVAQSQEQTQQSEQQKAEVEQSQQQQAEQDKKEMWNGIPEAVTEGHETDEKAKGSDDKEVVNDEGDSVYNNPNALAQSEKQASDDQEDNQDDDQENADEDQENQEDDQNEEKEESGEEDADLAELEENDLQSNDYSS